MRSSWASRSGLVLLLALLPVAGAAQQGTEFQLHALGTFANHDVTGGGVGVLWRPGGRSRIGATLSVAARDAQLAGRGELAVHFLLNPGGRGGGFYSGGGLAGLVADDASRGYLMLLLGWESHPGGRSGWVVEAGLGGGVRALVGYRWRWLRR